MNPSQNRDVVELWGREFNIVRNGLSEAQVVSFVNELVKQHDLLIQRQEHMAALTQLAERTVTEAGKMAEDLKKEAANQAKADAQRITAEAEAVAARITAEAQARAQELIKQREAEITSSASKQAAEIKNQAEAAAKAEASRVLAEAEERGRRLVQEREAAAIANAGEQARVIREQAEAEASGMLERERQRIQPELASFVRNLHARLLAELEDLKTQVGSLSTELEQDLGGAPAPETAAPEAAVPAAKGHDEFLDLMAGPTEIDTDEPQWELEIVPPIDIMKIMNIVGYLDSLPQVTKTEIIPRNERTSVMVYLSAPLDIAETMRGLPEVGLVTEGEKAKGGKPAKLTISLSGSAENEASQTKDPSTAA